MKSEYEIKEELRKLEKWDPYMNCRQLEISTIKKDILKWVLDSDIKQNTSEIEG